MDTRIPHISGIAPQDRAEVATLVFGRLQGDMLAQQVATLLDAVASGEFPADGFLGAYRGDRMVGAALWQVQPGRTAAVWPPRVVDGEPFDTAERLLQSVCRSLAERDVRFAQSLVETASPIEEAALRSQGFRHLADMLYLVCMEVEFPTQLPEGTLQFETYCAENHDRLTTIVEATYQQSLDCPEIDGLRGIEDVLAGYRASGVFDPDHWLLVRHQGNDVGCLLLADHPAHGNLELLYMGVVASQRGQGWGMKIAQHAKWLTRVAGRHRLVLAVDAANGPAIRMYSAVGFQAWDRRRVYVKVFESATGQDG